MIRHRVLPAALFLGLGVLYFKDVLTGEFLLVERDLSTFFIPPRLLWIKEWNAASFPLWDPYFYAGQPLFATLQPGVLYPFSLLFGFLPFALAFNGTIVLHFVLAGVSTYALMRSLRASGAASLLAGIAFMLSGYLISVHNLLSTLLSVAWAPLFLLVYGAALVRRQGTLAALAGGVGTLMFLGGGVEVCFLTFALALGFTLCPGLVWDPGSLPPVRTRLGLFAGFGAVFAGLSAVQALPFLELSSLSIRANGLSYPEATTWSLHPWDLAEFFVPDLYGLATDLEKYWSHQNWLKSIYMGSMPFLLAGFLFLKPDRKSRALLLLFGISLGLALGGYTPVYRALYEVVPFFDKMRYPVKFIFLGVLVLAMAAGFGYDRFKDLLETDRARAHRWARGMLSLGCLAMGTFGVLHLFHDRALETAGALGWTDPEYNDFDVTLFNFKRFLGFTGVFGLAVFLAAEVRRGRRVFLGAVVGLLTLDLFFAHWGFYQKMETQRYFEKSENLRFLQSDPSLFRTYLPPETKNYQENIVVRSGDGVFEMMKERLEWGTALAQQVFSVGGIEVVRLGRYRDLYELVTTTPKPDATNLLHLLNTKYVVSIPPIDSPEFSLVHANLPIPEDPEKRRQFVEQGTIKVYENQNVLPRAFLVEDCRVVTTNAEFKRIFSDKAWQPRQQVLLEEEPEGVTCGSPVPSEKAPSGGVTRFEYGSRVLDLEVTAPAPRLLFLSEAYYPGWKAWVDGRPARIYRANYAFRAIVLPPGRHGVRFEYDPASFKIGAVLSGGTLLGCAVWAVRRVRRGPAPALAARPRPAISGGLE